MNTRMRNISESDFEQAFCEVRNGKNQLVSFTDHDFRDICYDIELMRQMILKISKKYPDVEFEFCNALEGMRKYFQLEPHSCNLMVSLDFGNQSMVITSNADIFGVQPFYCMKLCDGRYIWSNLDFIGDNKWAYTFDRDSVELDDVAKIGIAANSSSGVTDVVVIDTKTRDIQKRVLNER